MRELHARHMYVVVCGCWLSSCHGTRLALCRFCNVDGFGLLLARSAYMYMSRLCRLNEFSQKKKYNTVPTAVNLVTIHRKSQSNRVSSLFSIDFRVYTMMMRSLDFRQMTFIFLWMWHYYIFSHPVEIFSDDRTGGWESERWEIAKKRNRFRVFSHCSTHAYFSVRQNSVKQFKIFIFSGTHYAIAIAYVRVNF